MLMRKQAQRGALALLAAAALAACDNPVGEGTHITPNGFEIRSGEEVLVQATGRQTVVVTGGVTVQVGQELPLSIHYFQNGEEVAVPFGYWLDFAVPAGLAVWEPTTAGAFSGVLRGVAAGAGTSSVRLMHGAVGSGHDDHAGAVPVVVTP